LFEGDPPPLLFLPQARKVALVLVTRVGEREKRHVL
jgi:hypothetical protein